jgi:hypothetical protein
MTDTPDTKHAMTRLLTETWASFHIRQKLELEAIERERDKLRQKLSEKASMGEVCIASREYIDGIERDRNELRERVAELESWIATAAPVFESACCIAIKDDAYRFHEIAGCRGIIESCPVELESTKTKENKWQKKTNY